VTQAAREMKSDYEKRQVLSMVAEENLDDQKVLSELITATATIGSDYERGQTITAALKRGSLTTAQLKGMLQSVAGISSDSYQGRRAVCPLAGVGPALRASPPPILEVLRELLGDLRLTRGREAQRREARADVRFPVRHVLLP